jgi:hypothetical protein
LVKGLINTAESIFTKIKEGVTSIVEKGLELAVDVAKGTVDAVINTVEDGLKVVDFAIKNGLMLTGKALEFAQQLYRDGVDKVLNLDKKIADLGTGDSYELSIEAEVALGLGVQTGKGVTIERTEDGYIVSGQFNAAVGIKAVAGLQVGGAGQFTFKATTAEEAKQLALILAGGPKPSEAGFIKDHLASIEVDATADLQAQLAKIGIGNIQDTLVGVVGGKRGVRIEFENGKPKDLVITQQTQAEGNVSKNGKVDPRWVALQKLANSLGIKLPDSVAANGQVSLSFETRIPIGDAANAASLIAQGKIIDLVKSGALNDASTTMKLEGYVEAKGNGNTYKGKEFSIEVSDLDLQEVGSLIKYLNSHNPADLKGVKVDIEINEDDYTRTDNSPWDIDALIYGLAGFYVDTKSESKDVDYAHRRHIEINDAAIV